MWRRFGCGEVPFPSRLDIPSQYGGYGEGGHGDGLDLYNIQKSSVLRQIVLLASLYPLYSIQRVRFVLRRGKGKGGRGKGEGKLVSTI